MIGPMSQQNDTAHVTLFGSFLGLASSPVGWHGMAYSFTKLCLSRGWEAMILVRLRPRWPGVIPRF
jgi:hypothetical protein